MHRLAIKITCFVLITTCIVATFSVPCDAYKITNTPADFRDELGNGLRFTLQTNLSSNNIWYGQNYTIMFDLRQDGWYLDEDANITCRLILVEIELDFGEEGQYTLVQEFHWDIFYELTVTNSGYSAGFNYSLLQGYIFMIDGSSSPLFDSSRKTAKVNYNFEFRWDAETSVDHYFSLFRVSNYLPGGNLLFIERNIPVVVNDYSKVESTLLGLNWVCIMGLIIVAITFSVRLFTENSKLKMLPIYSAAITLLLAGVFNTYILTVILGLMEESVGFSFSYSSRGVLIGIFLAALVGYIVVFIKNLMKDYSSDSTDIIGYEKSIYLAGIQTERTIRKDEDKIGFDNKEFNSRKRISLLQPMVFTLWGESVFLYVLYFAGGVQSRSPSALIPQLCYFTAFIVMSIDLHEWYGYRKSRVEKWDTLWTFYYISISENVDTFLKYLDLDEIGGFEDSKQMEIASELESYFGDKEIPFPSSDNTSCHLASGLAFQWIHENILNVNDLHDDITNLDYFQEKVKIAQEWDNPWQSEYKGIKHPLLKLAIWFKFATSSEGIPKKFLIDADNILRIDNLYQDFKVQIVHEYHRFQNREREGAFPDFDQWTAIILGISATLGSVIGPFFAELLTSFI